MEYVLKVPKTVICGEGCAAGLSGIIKGFNEDNIAVFVDAGVLKSGCADDVLSAVKREIKTVTVVDSVPPEPSEQQVRDVFDHVKNCGARLIVAIGGGSIMDSAKIFAAMLTNPGYYSDLTDKSKIVNPGAPLIVVPTSAGTGSESTPNAIILIAEKKVKVGVVHPYFLPDTVLIDPTFTRSLPPAVTASTGLDAFCHCIETYISKKTNPFARIFALRGIELICRYLRRAYNDGGDMEARENMMLAAFFGGVAITSSSTVAVHALSYPLGGTYHIPHGISNAILLPYVMRFNMDAIYDCVPEIADAMNIPCEGLSVEQIADSIVNEIFKLVSDVGIPSDLKGFGVSADDLEFLTVSASEVHRLIDQNPKTMSLDDIRGIYSQLL